jgi:Tfp pilus assembly protein FimT
MKKCSFTLLELIIGMSILLVAFSFLSLNIFRSLEEYHVKKDLQEMEYMIRFARQLAIASQMDVSMKMVTTQKKTRIYLTQNMGKNSNPSLFSKKIILSHLRIQKPYPTIIFTSTGTIDLQNDLVLMNSKKTKKYFIDINKLLKWKSACFD